MLHADASRVVGSCRATCSVHAIRWLGLLFGLAVCGVAQAAGFFVLSAKSELQDNVYRLTANVNSQLSPDVEKALGNGIAVVMQLDIEVLRPGAYYLWSETIATLQQQYRVQYHALSRRYLVTNVNSASQDYFSSLDDVMASLGAISDLPILDKSLLVAGAQYAARVRFGINFDTLPVPLRYYAHVLPQWRLQSEWYNFPL